MFRRGNLVGGIPTPLKDGEAVGRMTFPTESKVITFMFQTTNQRKSKPLASHFTPKTAWAPKLFWLAELGEPGALGGHGRRWKLRAMTAARKREQKWVIHPTNCEGDHSQMLHAGILNYIWPFGWFLGKRSINISDMGIWDFNSGMRICNHYLYFGTMI